MAILFLSMSFAVCSAGTISPSVPDQKYLSYGAEHECVVPIYGKCECGKHKEPHDFSASAVVLGPRWVVTAAHVVTDKSGVKVRVKEREHSMKRVVINRRFKEEMLGKYDIALCESEDDMDLDFYPELYDSDDEIGKVASICGYGSTGTFNTGWTRNDGRKRAGSNIVDGSYNHVLICTAKRNNRTSLEFLIAPGDSGGGMFIDGKLAGVNSFVMTSDGKSNSDWGDEAAHTRISLFSSWIKARMRGEELDCDIR